MPAPCFIAHNNATGALTAAAAAQPSAATAIPKTMLQIAPSANQPIRVIAWGYSLLTLPAAFPLIELIDTTSIFASGLTAHVAAGIHKWNLPAGTASTVQLGTALTGYATATAPTEGVITATRLLDYNIENGAYYKMQFPLGREPEINAANCLRVRVTPGSAAAVNLNCWVSWEE